MFPYLCIIHWHPIRVYGKLFLETALECIGNILVCVSFCLCRKIENGPKIKDRNWKNIKITINKISVFISSLLKRFQSLLCFFVMCLMEKKTVYVFNLFSSSIFCPSTFSAFKNCQAQN